jgi:hypothetical protein
MSVAEIRARAAAAIEGPWGWFGHTDSVYLATNHSGRQYILSPDVVTTQYVFDHDDVEGYPLEEARERYLLKPGTLPLADYVTAPLDDLRALASARGLVVVNAEIPDDPPIEDDYDEALRRWDEDHRLIDPLTGGPAHWATAEGQERLRDFLAGDLDPTEGDRHLPRRDQGGHPWAWLSRGVQTTPTLHVRGEGRMVTAGSVARFEVLGDRTIEQAERELDRVNLYRDTVSGLGTPEMDFIANARSDMDELLAEVERLRMELWEVGRDLATVKGLAREGARIERARARVAAALAINADDQGAADAD